MRKYLLLVLFSVIFVSCSKSSKQYESALYSDMDEVFLLENESYVQTSARAKSVYSAAENYEASEINDTPVIERKLIKTGNIELSVNSLEDSDKNIEGWTKRFGGYIASSNMYVNGGRYTVKIPQENFDDAMNSAAEFGKVRNRSVKVKDVTDQFYDLQSRLETKKILQEKYNQYLKKADNMKDLLEVERELNNVISEIESMEGQMKRLSHEISYSTIEIYLTAVTTEQGIDYYIEKIEWKEVLSNIINFFIKLFVIIIYVIVFGIPLVAIAAALYWLLFGKIGLLKKLFARLRGKK